MKSYIHIIDISTGQTTSITPRRADSKAEPVFAGVAKWSKDGKAIYYLTDKGSEFRRLARHDLVTGADAVLSGSIPWDIEDYDLSDDGTLIAAVANEDGSDVLHVISAATGVDFTEHRLPAGQISGLKFRKGSHELGFTRSSAQESADAYSFDLDEAMKLLLLLLTGAFLPGAGPRARPAGWTPWRSRSRH